MLGCGAAQPKQQGEENAFDTTRSGKVLVDSVDVHSPSDPPSKSGKPTADSQDARPQVEALASERGFTDDQKAQLQVALRRGAAKAAQCVSVVANAPHADGEVKVKFDGQVGRAVDVDIPSVFSETPRLGDCIKNAFMHEYVMRFDGTLVVPFVVKLDPKGK